MRAIFSSCTTSPRRLSIALSRLSFVCLKSSNRRIMSPCVTSASGGMPALVSSCVSVSMSFSLCWTCVWVRALVVHDTMKRMRRFLGLRSPRRGTRRVQGCLGQTRVSLLLARGEATAYSTRVFIALSQLAAKVQESVTVLIIPQVIECHAARFVHARPCLAAKKVFHKFLSQGVFCFIPPLQRELNAAFGVVEIHCEC